MMYDLIIIGGGPAACGAAVYAARKRLKSALIAKEIGGQSIVSDDIQNWIGFPHISGTELAKRLREHIEEYADDVLDLHIGTNATKIERTDEEHYRVTTDDAVYTTKTLIIATGSKRRKLPARGADTYEHKGLTYCATCDGPLFAGKDVAVIGGGNAGFETAAQLLAYANSVTLLTRGPEFKADEITVEKVLSHPKMTAIRNAEILEVTGDTMVNGLVYKDTATGTQHTLAVGGIFVEIGQIPATDLVAHLVERNKFGQIVIDPWTQKTSAKGIWAAGDCTNVRYHQNNIAVGDGVKALEDVYNALHAS